MKKFNIIWTQTISHETTVEAGNEKEARKKFKEVMPFDKLDKIWEIN